MFTTELKDHILINNWANGFVLDNTTSDDATIVIIFWPQYLEFIGFGLLILTVMGIVLKKKNSI